MVKWLSDNTGVDEGAVNIGIIHDQKGLFLVDTGIDNSAINKVRKQLEEKIFGAMITHHHADHMGGASKLEALGVSKIYGPSNELPLIHNPQLEPFSMFGGALPPKQLRNRHLEARQAPTVQTSNNQDVFEVIATPGHTLDHQCFKYHDVLFTGDSAFTHETIDKYHLLFAVDPASAAISIDTLMEQSFDQMIPGHGAIQESRSDALDVLRGTKDHYTTMEARILEIIGESLPYSRYLTTALDALGLTEIIKDRGYLQYILYQVPLMAYLSNLLDKKNVVIETHTGDLVISSQ